MLAAGLSSGAEITLGLVALAFIAFALTSAFVLPRYRPDFPGKQGLRAYIVVAVLFFVAMMLTVIFVAKEPDESTAAETTNAAATTTTTGGGGPAATLAAGKKVFGSAGCASCHTLKDAGATATVGPDLDTLKPDEARVARQVRNGGASMPPFKGSLSAAQIAAVATYVSSVAG
jgi:sulfite dehydrogenase